MDSPVLMDTDVMVDYLRGLDAAISFVAERTERIILSAIVVAELYAGVRDDTERPILDDLVSLFPVIPVTAQIAAAAGLLRRDFGKSHGVGLADAIIAATAKSAKADLATLNVKHYPMLIGLQPAYSRE